MSGTPFVSIETVDGIVTNVEGEVSSGGVVIMGKRSHEFIGQRLNDVLNKCARLGYEHFDTDIIGKSKIYRLKLSAK